MSTGYQSEDTQSARYKQTVAPTAEPVSIEDARLQCSIIGTDWDAMLAGLISDARRTIERRHQRQLMPATYTLSLDGFPEEIVIERTPVSAVTSVAYVDGLGATQVIPAAQYQVDLSSPNSAARIRPVWGSSWPSTQPDKMNCVVVTFTAGYASAALVPGPYRRAILMMVWQMFKSRGMTSDGSSAAEQAFEWLMQAEDPGGCA